jgi:hypothetical protein
MQIEKGKVEKKLAAVPKPKGIDLNKKLNDEQGQPIKLVATKAHATLRELLLTALAIPADEQKKERYLLIKKLEKASTVESSDLPLISKWVDKAYPSPVVWGRIMDELAN